MKRIISLILAISMFFCLAGCGEEKKAKETVSGMMEAFKALDFDTAGKYVSLDEIKVGEKDTANSETGKTMLKAVFEKLDYEILSTQLVDDNTVKVKTKITAVEMASVISEYAAAALQYAFSYAFSEEQPADEVIQQKNIEFFMEAVKNNIEKTATAEVDITVVNEDGTWKVKSDDALSDALLGGLRAAVEKLEDSFNSIGEE